MGFTEDNQNQVKVFSYAQMSQVKKLRKKISALCIQRAGQGSLKQLVEDLLASKIENDVKSACQSIFPLWNVHVYKVKIVKKPKTDIAKLLEIHEGAPAEAH